MIKKMPIQTIVTIISVCVSLYIFFNSQAKEKALRQQTEKEIMGLTMKLLNTESKLSVYEEQITILNKSLLNSNKRLEISNFKQDSLLKDNIKKDVKIAELDKKLNSKPTILDLSDDDQWKFFIEWTNTFPN